ncbi:MAG: FAD-dependent oxidoreductase [Planctomycetota bacterium]
MKTYDVLVLGGGTAGTAAAKAAHQAGQKTAMFNDGELGGLCILRGCMPTKTMLHAAHLRHEAAHHHTPGIGRAELSVDFPAVMANKDAKVERFKSAKIRGIEAAGYEVLDARAKFVGPDTIEAGGETYKFEKGAVIATGSTQFIPDVPGLKESDYLDSDGLMQLTEQPKSCIVLGTGAIGLEFAQFFARLGSEVHVLARRRIFQDLDEEVGKEMRAVFEEAPSMHLHDGHTPIAVRQLDGRVEVDAKVGAEIRTFEAERLIVATGRRAALDGLGLEAAGINRDRHTIPTDADMRTSNPRVFVAGDASGFKQLLHVANWEGAVAGMGAAQVPGPHAVEQRLDVSVIFFDPPLATVGLSELDARKHALEVVTASARFPETGRAITMDVQHGLLKLVADRQSGEILGAQILGPRADDMIHTISTLMYFHGTAQQMLEMPWYHPTLSEVLLQLARDIETQRKEA